MIIPVAFPIISLAFGIVVAEWFPTPYAVVVTIVSCVLAFGLLFIQYRKESKLLVPGTKNFGFFIVLALVWIGLGYALMMANTPGMEARHYTRFCADESLHLVAVRVVEVPTQSAKTVKFVAKVEGVKDDAGWHSTCGRVMIFAVRDSQALQLQRGDRLLIYASLRLPSNASNPYQFDYRKYLKHKGIVRQCYITSVQYHLIAHDTNRIRVQLDRVRNFVRSIIAHSTLTSGQQGVAEALLLGWKEDVDETTQTQFRDAGITHLLCVSGLHVGIVAALIGWCLSFLPFRFHNRIVKGCIQIIGVWFFIMISGMAPSAMRAGLMFSFIIVGKMMSNQPPTLNAIASSALVLLTVRPALLFDVGFQLSYVAVIGIVVLNRPMQNLLPLFSGQSNMPRLTKDRKSDVSVGLNITNVMLWLGRKVWVLICVSTTAQLATLPLVLYYFHQFPLYFLIANITIVPFAGVLMATLIAMVSVAWFPLAFRGLVATLSVELGAMDHITRWISQLPNALIEGIYFDAIMAVLCGLLLIVVAWVVNNRDRKCSFARGTIVVLFLLLILYIVIIRIQHNRQQLMVLYSTPQTTAIELISGRESLLIVADCEENILRKNIDYQRKNNVVHSGIQHSDTVYMYSLARWQSHHFKASGFGSYMMLGNIKILVVDQNNDSVLVRRAQQSEPPHFRERLHYIVLAQTPYISVAQLQRLYDFDTLVLAADNAVRYRVKCHKESVVAGVGYYDVATQGALVRKIH